MSTRRPTFKAAAKENDEAKKQLEEPAAAPQLIELSDDEGGEHGPGQSELQKSTDEISRRLTDLKEEVNMAALMESCALEEVEAAKVKVDAIESRLVQAIRDAELQLEAMRSAMKTLEEAHGSRQQLGGRVRRILEAFED